MIFNFQWILEFGKTLKFAQGDFGGILIWGFFLNSSRILKDFRKIKYAMLWHASFARLLLKIFLYARLIRYATYMHFYAGEILSLQKAGVTQTATCVSQHRTFDRQPMMLVGPSAPVEL
jgi:hypothetical protein